MERFGTRLKRLRKASDITQAELAAELGVEPSAVGKYENGIQSYPRVEVLIKIAEYFNVSIDYLVRGIESAATFENHISGSLTNSALIQSSNCGVVYGGGKYLSLSPETLELLRIYEAFDGRRRLELLKYAVELENASKNQ